VDTAALGYEVTAFITLKIRQATIRSPNGSTPCQNRRLVAAQSGPSACPGRTLPGPLGRRPPSHRVTISRE
jgi:hypothetical protein